MRGRLLAGLRSRLEGLRREEGASAAGDRLVVTRWFLRLLGLIHLFNFGSLAVQVERCLGREGLLPAADYLKNFDKLPWRDRLVECPSLFHLASGDGMLVGGAWLGIAASLAVIAGLWTRAFLVLSFLLYLSYVSIGQVFYSFQWDSLLLETTFLAILLPSSGLLFRGWSRGADRLQTWLFLWLLFRLYVESGVAKLFWGPETWSTLEGMNRYYETAPIPTVWGWRAHALSASWHRFEALAALTIEILLPALFFSGRWARGTALLIFTGFQAAITLTANYGIFNYNTLILHLWLLDDKDLAAIAGFIKPLGRLFPAPPAPPASPRWWMYPAAALVVVCSLIEYALFAAGQGAHKTDLPRLHRYTGALRIASRYHLFGPIDPVRYELCYEGSANGKEWAEYPFPYKAGDLTRPPPFVAPHHPRVDFRLWFERYPGHWPPHLSAPYPDASVSPKALPAYMGRLAEQLLDKPESALRHFTADPLGGKKPKEVRIVFYHYKMTSPESQKGKSPVQYWTRTRVGTVYVDPRLGIGGRPMATVGRTTRR